MWDRFGEFDSATEINELAVNLRKEGDADSLKELAVQFKGFQLYSLDEPLSARIQAILDQTDADERLQEALSRMQQNWHQRISAFRHTRRRLHAAFPKRAENVRLRNIRDLVNALDEHLRGRGE